MIGGETTRQIARIMQSRPTGITAASLAAALNVSERNIENNLTYVRSKTGSDLFRVLGHTPSNRRLYVLGPGPDAPRLKTIHPTQPAFRRTDSIHETIQSFRDYTGTPWSHLFWRVCLPVGSLPAGAQKMPYTGSV
jgi:hypothetical protein